MRRFSILLIAILTAAGAGWWFGKPSKTFSGTMLPEISEGTRIATWNLHWFPGHTQKRTPEAEATHIEPVAATLAELDADILCLQEIKGAEAADRLLEALPGYRLQVREALR